MAEITNLTVGTTNYTIKDANAIPSSEKGVNGGIATLGADGKVPANQLPSYVDDVIEGYYYNGKFWKESAHTTEITGEGGKIYVDLATNKSYRYSGSTYVEISGGGSVVSITRNLTSGTKVGTITIDGTGTDLYAPSNTDTKNTAGATDNKSSNLYLVGATSQGANPQTYSRSDAYISSGGALSVSAINVKDGRGSGMIFVDNIDCSENESIEFNAPVKFIEAPSVGNVNVKLATTVDVNNKVDKTTKVNGHALSGDVTVTASDVGLGNVGNFKAVSTVASQGLTDTEKANARANIGAGTSSFSGSYDDLTDKPDIPTVNNGSLTIQRNGVIIRTFFANQSSNDSVDILVPTKTSDLTNDRGFTSNTGTVTSVAVKMNGATKGTITTKGEIDLGDVATEDTHGSLNGAYDSDTKTLTLSIS